MLILVFRLFQHISIVGLGNLIIVTFLFSSSSTYLGCRPTCNWLSWMSDQYFTNFYASDLLLVPCSGEDQCRGGISLPLTLESATSGLQTWHDTLPNWANWTEVLTLVWTLYSCNIILYLILCSFLFRGAVVYLLFRL